MLKYLKAIIFLICTLNSHPGRVIFLPAGSLRLPTPFLSIDDWGSRWTRERRFVFKTAMRFCVLRFFTCRACPSPPPQCPTPRTSSPFICIIVWRHPMYSQHASQDRPTFSTSYQKLIMLNPGNVVWSDGACCNWARWLQTRTQINRRRSLNLNSHLPHWTGLVEVWFDICAVQKLPLSSPSSANKCWHVCQMRRRRTYLQEQGRFWGVVNGRKWSVPPLSCYLVTAGA